MAAGIRRLARIFTTLALAMLAACLYSWLSGFVFPGLLALAVAAVVGLAWRMSNDLRPQRLTLEPGRLTIGTTRQSIEISIEGATIRALTPSEIDHLEGLASAGGIVAGSGGFDSRHLGEFDLYASDLGNSLFIQGAGGRWVITPDRPAEFLTRFEQMAALPLLQSSPHE